MPVFNGEKYLKQSIESILNQTYSDFEFIIINDGSTDHSLDIISSFKDSRIQCFENKENIGITRSLNHGLILARGEYIARMDADDFSLPGRLEAQVAHLDANPEIGVLSVAACIIDSAGVLSDSIVFPADHFSIQWRMCFFENPIIHPGVMFRKELVLAVGGYDENLTTSQDYILWCLLSAYTKFANLQDVFLYLRKHTENISIKYNQEQIYNIQKSCVLLISKILNEHVHFDEMLSFFDFLWKKSRLSKENIIYVSNIISHLAKTFLREILDIKNDVRILIKNDANKKIFNLMKSKELCFIDILRLKCLILLIGNY